MWSIPFKCPELQAQHPKDDNILDDVKVIMKDTSKFWKKNVKDNKTIQVSENRAFFSFIGIGRFVILNGETIYIDKKVEINKTTRLFLFGTVASLLLLQRGLVPLHGSGILFKGEAILFLGHSGFGKSTILAGLMKKGYKMLTDDIAAIDTSQSVPCVLPSFPSLKLWADSLVMLNKSTEGLDYIRDDDKLLKYRVPTENIASNKTAIPINTIYILNPSKQPTNIIESLQNKEKVNALINYTFQKMALKRQNLHKEHFLKVMQIVNYSRIVELNRPEKGMELNELVNLIENDLISDKNK